MKTLAAIGMLALIGCASSTGVVPIGQDTYMISHRGGTGMSNLGELKAECFRDANEYCEKEHKKLMPVNEREHPIVFAGLPSAEIQFMCLSPGDPQLIRPRMAPTPNNVVEIRK